MFFLNVIDVWESASFGHVQQQAFKLLCIGVLEASTYDNAGVVHDYVDVRDMPDVVVVIYENIS